MQATRIHTAIAGAIAIRGVDQVVIQASWKQTKTKDMNPTLVTLNTYKPNLTLLPPHPPNQLTKQSNYQNLYYNPLMAQIQWNGYSKQSNFSIIIQSLLLNASLEFHVT